MSIREWIESERRLQDERWPEWADCDSWQRLAVLVEEVGEVARALNDEERVGLRDELVQVAAVSIRWLETL